MHKIDKISKKLHEVAVEKGFWDAVIDYDFLCTKLLLIHSEVTEATEALRKNKGPEALAEEMVDILIRTLDLYEGMYEYGYISSDLSHILEYKHKKNKEREHLHGNNF